MSFSTVVKRQTPPDVKSHVSENPAHTVLIKCGEINEKTRPDPQQVYNISKKLHGEIPPPKSAPKIKPVYGGILMEFNEAEVKNTGKDQLQKVQDKLNFSLTRPKSRKPRLLLKGVPTKYSKEDMKSARRCSRWC